jgi:hypothetical protein
MYVIVELDIISGGSYDLPRTVVGPFESHGSALEALTSLEIAHQDDPVDFTIVRCTAIEQYWS